MNTYQINSQLLASILVGLLSVISNCEAKAQQRRAPAGGRIAVVVDERLSALRMTPELSGKLLRRLGRGKLVAIRSARESQNGIVFFLINVTRRTHGWIQREALASPSNQGDDKRLLALIESSSDFDRIARARIFLDFFSRSTLRPRVLLLLGDTANEAADRVSRDASRRLEGDEMKVGAAPLFSYYMNFSGLDRYNRQGLRFVFDAEKKRFRYNGQSWREILRLYPRSLEAVEATRRLQALASMSAQ